MLSEFDVAKANEILGAFYGQLQHRSLPAFGSDMLLSDDSRNSTIVGATIAHRFISKFQKPNASTRSLLTRECYRDWVDFDEGLGLYDFNSQSSRSRGQLYRARALIHEWVGKFKIPLSGVDIEFTPGETFVSSQGYVSVYQKLKHKKNWTVTYDAADDFIRLCYNTLSLRRCAKKHMAHLSRHEYTNLYREHSASNCVGLAVFAARMYAEVLTLVHGSRGSTVDKNNSKRRFINVEPLGNVILQRIVALQIRHILKGVGNDLEIGQAVHQVRIAQSDVATIDFSNASDSVVLAVCKLLLPASLFTYLDRYRSPMVLVDGCYFMPNKLSSMGNGFTFEVMTLLLLAVARTLDDTSTVYGDDVIISNAFADEFVEVAQAMCFKVNKQKTFIKSPFRESCGSFYLDGYGYITCFDIHYCETPQDVIINTNKFWLMARKDHCLKEFCVAVYEALVSCVPPCCLGPTEGASRDNLSSYAYSSSYRRARMRSTSDVKLWKNVQEVVAQYASEHHYNVRDVVLTYVPRLQPDLGSPSSSQLMDQGAKYASYLYGGRVSDDVIRNSGKWVYNLHLLLPSGLLVPFKSCNQRYSENVASWIAIAFLSWGISLSWFNEAHAGPVRVRQTT